MNRQRFLRGVSYFVIGLIAIFVALCYYAGQVEPDRNDGDAHYPEARR